MSVCICPRFRDTGGFRIADLTCPVHGIGGTEPADGYWRDDEMSDDPTYEQNLYGPQWGEADN